MNKVVNQSRSNAADTSASIAGDFRWLKKKLNLEQGTGENTEQAITSALLDHFQRQAPPVVLLVNVISAAALVAVMWAWVPHTYLLAWLLAQTVIVAGNHFLYRAFQYRKKNSSRYNDATWYKLFCTGVLFNGLSWGLAASSFYNVDAHLQSVFMILIVAGLSAGVTTVQASLKAGFILFITPALLLPVSIILYRFGVSELTVSLLLILYYCAISYTGFNNNATITETIRLRFEKDNLLAQLHSSEAYFRALIENSTDLVLVVDKNATIFFQSPSSYQMIGYRPDELNGLCLLDFIHADDREAFRSTLNHIHKHSGVVAGGDSRLRHREGHWLVLEGNGRTMDVNTDLIVINARDITERCAMERELREAKINAETANQAKSLFLANMSHEIRTPMHAILAMADILRESELDDQQTRHVDAFKNAGEHLLSLLNDLLDFSRIETGELKLANAPFHLPQLIENIFDLMWAQAQAKNLALHYEIDPTLRPWHLGDPQRLRQIIVNLVSNAIKFTEKGEITISIQDAGSNKVRLEVIDTGEGIANDKLALIFEAFQQADKGVTNRYGGAGLGLAICKRLAETMSGSISVRSEINSGTRFTCDLLLPSTDEPSEWLDHRDRDSAIVVAKLPPSHILVADDSAMNRMVIEEFLRFTSCTMSFAVNGQEALDKLEKQHYDLILMDLRMPVMDGLSAARVIRQRKELVNIPIVALTAGVSQEDKEKALDAGCNDYLVKPVSKEELTRTLVKFLQNK